MHLNTSVDVKVIRDYFKSPSGKEFIDCCDRDVRGVRVMGRILDAIMTAGQFLSAYQISKYLESLQKAVSRQTLWKYLGLLHRHGILDQTPVGERMYLYGISGQEQKTKAVLSLAILLTLSDRKMKLFKKRRSNKKNGLPESRIIAESEDDPSNPIPITEDIFKE